MRADHATEHDIRHTSTRAQSPLAEARAEVARVMRRNRYQIEGLRDLAVRGVLDTRREIKVLCHQQRQLVAIARAAAMDIRRAIRPSGYVEKRD